MSYRAWTVKRISDELREAVADLAYQRIAEIVEDWKEATTPDERERLHAELCGINKMREALEHGEESSSEESTDT